MTKDSVERILARHNLSNETGHSSLKVLSKSFQNTQNEIKSKREKFEAILKDQKEDINLNIMKNFLIELEAEANFYKKTDRNYLFRKEELYSDLNLISNKNSSTYHNKLFELAEFYISNIGVKNQHLIDALDSHRRLK